MICSSLFKNGSLCTFKAKYDIFHEDKHTFVCKRHVQQSAETILGRVIKVINNITEVKEITHITPDKNIQMDFIDDAISMIKLTSNLNVESDGNKIALDNGIEYQNVKIGEDEFILTTYRDEPLMTDMYEAMCIQVCAKKCNAFLPIKDYEVLGSQYFISKMVYSKVDTANAPDTNRKIPYFYQLTSRSTPLREFEFQDGSLEKFALHMCEMIQELHSARMCLGDFNYSSIVMTDLNDPKSARISSAKNISFWIDTHGEFKTEHRSGPGTKFPLTASRRVHSKNAPGRYDDFESLLYLILTIQGKILPWDDSTSLRDFTTHKNAFLKDPSLHVKSHTSLEVLCDLIYHSEYDERPVYDRISKLFTDIVEFK